MKPSAASGNSSGTRGGNCTRGTICACWPRRKGAGNWRLYYLMETLASTGIRVSELKFVTVQALHAGRAWVEGKKGKGRLVLLTPKLCRVLARKYRQRGHHRGRCSS